MNDLPRPPSSTRASSPLFELRRRMNVRARALMDLETKNRETNQHDEAGEYCLQRLAVGNCIADLEDVLRNVEHGDAEWIASENTDLAGESAMLRRLILGHRELRALARFLRLHGDLETTNAAALTSIMLDNLAAEVEKLDPFA